ncbi:MAG: hypothetical protein VX278_08350 [Myxococcota bacterium]|nr:hypothetical protein [Myxococcota bacterium]
MKKISSLPILLGSMLYSPQSLAQESIQIAKALGLSKLSESYLLSEQIAESIQEKTQTPTGILSGNSCTEVACQVDKAKEAGAQMLITVEITPVKKKYRATIGFHNTETGKTLYSKRVFNASLAGLKEILPETAYSSGQKYIDRTLESKTSDTITTENTETDWFDNEKEEGVTEGVAEGVTEGAAEESTETEEMPPPPAPVLTLSTLPFEGLRVRSSLKLGYYGYNQRSEEARNFISPNVEFQTVLPDIQIEAEYSLLNNMIGVDVHAGIAPFGYSLQDDTSTQTITDLKVGARYRYVLDGITVEGGLAYQASNGIGFLFTNNRTSVGSSTKDLSGVALRTGFITQASNMDIRLEVCETFAPIPVHTQINLLVEGALAPMSGMTLTFNGGAGLDLRHFDFENQGETADIFDLQANVFGGAGLKF